MTSARDGQINNSNSYKKSRSNNYQPKPIVLPHSEGFITEQEVGHLQFSEIKEINFYENQHKDLDHAFVKNATDNHIFPFSQLAKKAAEGYFNNETSEVRLIQSVDGKVYFSRNGEPDDVRASHSQGALLVSLDDPNILVSNHFALNGSECKFNILKGGTEEKPFIVVEILEVINKTGAFKSAFNDLQLMLIVMLDDMVNEENHITFAETVNFGMEEWSKLDPNKRPMYAKYSCGRDELVAMLTDLKNLYQHTFFSAEKLAHYALTKRAPVIYREVESAVEHTRLKQAEILQKTMAALANESNDFYDSSDELTSVSNDMSQLLSPSAQQKRKSIVPKSDEKKRKSSDGGSDEDGAKNERNENFQSPFLSRSFVATTVPTTPLSSISSSSATIIKSVKSLVESKESEKPNDLMSSPGLPINSTPDDSNKTISFVPHRKPEKLRAFSRNPQGYVGRESRKFMDDIDSLSSSTSSNTSSTSAVNPPNTNTTTSLMKESLMNTATRLTGIGGLIKSTLKDEAEKDALNDVMIFNLFNPSDAENTIMPTEENISSSNVSPSPTKLTI